jgi:hypothetical protein
MFKLGSVLNSLGKTAGWYSGLKLSLLKQEFFKDTLDFM